MTEKKKTIYIKNSKTSKKLERFCLNCGINISHRSKDVQFCCPACKAIYKQNHEYTKDARPEMPKCRMTNTEELPYSSYQVDLKGQLQPRLKTEMPEMLVVSTPKDTDSSLNQIQKFYKRYNQNKES